jgi:hypothetical protein
MPEWALLEAAKRSGSYPADFGVGKLRYEYRASGSFRALCDMILKHEQPPVDPKLRIARETCAQVCEEEGAPTSAAEYRVGNCDNVRVMQIAMRAIDLWEKQQ